MSDAIKPRVFVFEPPKNERINVDVAEEFGEIVFLFPHGHARAGVFETESFMTDVIITLCSFDFNPLFDYICLSGSLLVVTVGFHAVMKEWKRAKVLMFSANNGRYYSRELSMSTGIGATNGCA